jgi:hypothetical protein
MGTNDLTDVAEKVVSTSVNDRAEANASTGNPDRSSLSPYRSSLSPAGQEESSAAPERPPGQIKLNLGCGFKRLDGWVNVDAQRGCEPDVCFDLDWPDWPWETGSVGEVLLNHVLEHIHHLPLFMQRLYRVCAPGARITITVPHHRSEGFAGDPTHVRPITAGTLSLFSQVACKMFRERGWPNTPLAVYYDVDFEVDDVKYDIEAEWKGLPADTLLKASEAFCNVVKDVTFVLRRV